jgi:enoyl-CoA hydratase
MSKVLTEIEERIFIITINRPEVHNCIDWETAKLLEEAWKRFRDDDSLYVAVLTGAGKQAFSSGADLKNIESLGPGPKASSEEIRHFILDGPGYLGYTRQTDIYKPIIAAVNGWALAGGLELCCLADIRIAGANARFGVSSRRWNIPLLDGGTQRLPCIVGMGRAMELILTGRVIDAREAYRIGLVNEVVRKGKALPRALELAAEISRLPQGSIRTDKQSVLIGYGRALEDGLRLEAEVGQMFLESTDLQEGIHPFLEKHPPKYL